MPYTVTTIDKTKDQTWPAQAAEDFDDLQDLLESWLEDFIEDLDSMADDKARNRLRSKARRLQRKFKDWYEDALDDELEEGDPVEQTVDDGGKGVILRIELAKEIPAS